MAEAEGMTRVERFAALIAIYEHANYRALHYHTRIWETAQLFFWAYTLPISASFYLYSQDTSLILRYTAIPLSLVAYIVAIYGKRVLAQERLLFAHELRVRNKIEEAVGWQLNHPAIQHLGGPFWTTTDAEDSWVGLSYDPQRATYDPRTYNAIEFDDDDRSVVLQTSEERKGGYGVLQRIFSAAWLFAILATAFYSAEVFLTDSTKIWLLDRCGIKVVATTTTTTATDTSTTVTTTAPSTTTTTAPSARAVRRATGSTAATRRLHRRQPQRRSRRPSRGRKAKHT